MSLKTSSCVLRALRILNHTHPSLTPSGGRVNLIGNSRNDFYIHSRPFDHVTLRSFSVSHFLAADKKTTLKKPFTPKGKFDLEDDAKKKELDEIREELRQKEEQEKKQDAIEEEKAQESEVVYGELVNEVTGERGGPKGQEPTEYGDWQRKGRVTDF